MDTEYIKSLDEYFCAKYSDYTHLAAVAGYKRPDLIYIAKDGNVTRKDSALLKLDRQEKQAEILANLKAELADTNFTFSFSFPTFRERVKDKFRKYTFAKILPTILKHTDETAESAGAKIDIETKIWRGILKGKLYPEKSTIFALALACRLTYNDTNTLLAVCGFEFDEKNVRDVIIEYLLAQSIYNEEMVDNCLREYKITSIPLKHEKAN